MTRFKSTWFYLLLAALLGGYIYFFERGPAKKEEEKKTKVFAGFVADDISDIRLENFSTTLTAEKAPIDIRKDEKGVWHILSPKQYKADESIVRTMLSNVGDFNPETTIEKPANLADYGLAKPSGRCEFKTKNGAVYTLLIGDKGMGNSSTYAKTGDKEAVHLLQSYLVEGLQKRINDYRDRTFFKTDLVLARKVRIVREGKTTVFEKGQDNVWRLAQPVQGKADEAKLRDLLNAVSNLRGDDFVEDHPADLGKYGLSPARISVEVWPGSGAPQSLLIGKMKGKNTSYYAKNGEAPAVLLVGQYIDHTLDLKTADYRDKTLLQFDAGLAKSLTVKRAGKTYLYQKGEKGEWESTDRPKAKDEASALIAQLSSLVISDFPSSAANAGLQDPSFTAEVALTDGNLKTYRFGRPEKDQLYVTPNEKKGDVYLVPSMMLAMVNSLYSAILTPVPVSSSPVPAPK